MARPRKVDFVDPSPKAYSLKSIEPEAMNTELTVLNQIRQDEMTIIWGLDDALPMHILTAIAESPVTTACIGKLEMFVKGESFSDEGLMTMQINKDGDTLWDLHCQLVPYFVSLDGFSLNFKYSNGAKIQQAFCLPFNSCRLSANPETTEITGLKYNPYFGTRDFQQRFTTPYSLFDPSKVKQEASSEGTKYKGQAYFYGTKRTLYKHYPVPKFWSAKKWIYSDAKMSTYVDKLLDNGFFQSALMKVIGDPNAMSRHPLSMKEVTGTDGTKRKEPTLTNGEVFDRMMAANFSGVERAATIMTFWSLNKDQAIDLTSFPTTANFDQINGTLLNTLRMISLATEIPGILVNLPDTSSPLSGQDSLPKAIEFVQSNTAAKRTTLENFYNNILIPNLQDSTKARVQIKQYSPAKVAVTVDDKFWEFMNEAEKIDFITKNEPNITIIRQPAALENTAPPTIDENGKAIPAPTVPQVDEVLKGLKVMEINRILSIVNKVNSGSLTPDQAKILLAGYGLNEEQIAAFLNPQPVEI